VRSENPLESVRRWFNGAVSWVAWPSVNDVDYANEVALFRARLALRWAHGRQEECKGLSYPGPRSVGGAARSLRMISFFVRGPREWA